LKVSKVSAAKGCKGLVQRAGAKGWCKGLVQGLVQRAGAKGWCKGLVQRAGAKGWCKRLVQKAGASPCDHAQWTPPEEAAARNGTVLASLLLRRSLSSQVAF
jgi:hypothetical protein